MQRRKIGKISIFSSLDVIFDFLTSWIKNSNLISTQDQYQIESECWNWVFESSQKIDIEYSSWIRRLILKLDLTISLIREKIVAWVSMSATAFLAHFAVLNSFLKNYSTFCMIFWYSLHFCFLMILLFLSYAWMYSVQSLMIQRLLLIHCMFLMIFVHFFIHFALIISYNLVQKVKISMIFFNASSSCLMYSFMHQHFILWFDNNFNICSLRVLKNFSLFIVFQLQHDFRANFLPTLKFIIVCINRWSEKFFISSSILHHINQFIMSSVVKIKFIVVWNSW